MFPNTTPNISLHLNNDSIPQMSLIKSFPLPYIHPHIHPTPSPNIHNNVPVTQLSPTTLSSPTTSILSLPPLSHHHPDTTHSYPTIHPPYHPRPDNVVITQAFVSDARETGGREREGKGKGREWGHRGGDRLRRGRRGTARGGGRLKLL